MPYDGSIPIDQWKFIRAREIKILTNRASALMQAKDADGKPLYRITESGNLARTSPLSKTTRRKVIERDVSCVQCGAGKPFEVDHITRYVDGGSNLPDNLQTLCVPCHRRKGGR